MISEYSAVLWTHYWLNAHAVPEHDWHVGQDKAHSMHSIATSPSSVVRWQVTVGLAHKAPNRQSDVQGQCQSEGAIFAIRLRGLRLYILALELSQCG
jgi:hypothetical protein